MSILYQAVKSFVTRVSSETVMSAPPRQRHPQFRLVLLMSPISLTYVLQYYLPHFSILLTTLPILLATLSILNTTHYTRDVSYDSLRNPNQCESERHVLTICRNNFRIRRSSHGRCHPDSCDDLGPRANKRGHRKIDHQTYFQSSVPSVKNALLQRRPKRGKPSSKAELLAKSRVDQNNRWLSIPLKTHTRRRRSIRSDIA